MRESFLHEKFRLRRRAIGADAVFDGNDAGNILAERRVNNPLLCGDVTVDNGEVFFYDTARLPDFTELAGGGGIFGEQHDAAGFAVQAVD